MLPHSQLPLIGASGAVAGVIAAYLILHPKVKVWVLALWRIPIKITAAWALGIWILAQFGNLLFESEEAVAWWAHVGGLAAGAVLILFMRRRGVVLFDRTRGGCLRAVWKTPGTIDFGHFGQYGRRHFAVARCWLWGASQTVRGTQRAA